MTGAKSSSSISAAASSLAMAWRPLASLAPALALVAALAAPAAAQTEGGTVSAPVPAAAQPIGVIDLAAVLQQSNAIAQIREAIDEKTTQFEEEISKEEVAIREVEAKLNEDKDLITEEEFRARVAEFEERVVALQRRIQQQRSSFDRAYADAQRRLEEQLLPIISELAGERGFAIVVQKKNAVLFDSALDITDEALARLNERTKNLKITLERKDGS